MMNFFLDYPLFTLFVVGLVIVLVTRVSQRRPSPRGGGEKLCRNCGSSHPSFARYCRRCGHKL